MERKTERKIIIEEGDKGGENSENNKRKENKEEITQR